MKEKVILLIFIALSFISYGQVTIWSEDFNDAADDGVGAVGPTPTITSPASGKWSVNVDNCNLSASTDWFKVVSQQLEARDVDGTQQSNGTGDGALWTSEAIDISAYSNISISVDVSESGDLENQDFVKASYKIDAGSITQFGFNYDDFGSNTYTVTGLSGTSLVIYLEADNNADAEYLRFDNVLVKGGPNNPGSFTATESSTSQIDLAFTTNGDGDNVVIVFDADGSFTTPSGAPPSAGSAFAGGTLLYNGTSSPYNHSSLSSGTQYYYKAWSYDGSDYSTGLTDNATTLSPEPSNHVTDFTATANGANQVDVSWTDDSGGAQNSHGVLILANTTGTFTSPVDGTAQADDTDLSDGSGVYNATRGDEAYSWTSLNMNTQYYFKTFTFTNSGSHIDYKTNGTPPTANATTADGTKIIITEVMQNPSDVSDADGEWFEIYNYGSTTVDINGFVLKDGGSDNHTINNGGALNIAAGAFMVLGRNSTSSSNGGVTVSYQYSSYSLTNTDDEIIIYETDGTTEVDRVEWDGGTNWPDPDGKSMTYTGQSNEDNNVGSKWIEAVKREEAYSNSGSPTDMGSPGKNGLFQNMISSTTWTGTGNWSEGNAVGNTNWSNGSPGSSVDVIIDGTCTVDLDGGTPAKCDDLTINAAKVLTIAANKALTVNGTLSNNAGTSGLVLKSDATGASSLVHNTASISAKVESYFADLNQWYLISPPISNATAAVFNLQYLDYWSEPDSAWVDITVETTALNVAQGYSVKKTNDNSDGNTATYSGTLNNGNISSQNLDFTNQSASFGDGWNLVGNPYPSVLDINELVFPTDINASVNVWKHDGSGYLAWSQSGGGDAEAQYIQPGQGFMVKLTADNQILPFTNAARTHTSLSLFDKGPTGNDGINQILKISIPYNSSENTAYISLREGATTGFDPNYDVIKLFGQSEYPNVFSYINTIENEKAAIQSIPQPMEGDIIHLGLRISIAGNYELLFSGMNSFADDQNFLVRDNETNEIFELRSDSIIEFNYKNGDPENRFDLIFDMTTNINNSEILHGGMTAFIRNNRLFIIEDNNFDRNGQLEVYNILGKKIMEQKVGEAFRGIPIDLPSAYYIIKLKFAEEVLTKKIFIP